MLYKKVLRLVIVLSFLCSAGVVLAQGRQYDDSALRALIEPTKNCSMPCWQGIQLGTTSLDEALRLLDDNLWVGEVRKRVGFRHIWLWSDQRPSVVSGSSQQYLLSWRGDIAETISMETLPASWQFWLILGRPDTITVAPINSNTLVYIASYQAEQLHVLNFASCEARTARAIWEQNSRLDIGRLVVFPIARPITVNGSEWLQLFHTHPFCDPSS